MDQRTLCPRYVFFCGTTISRNAGDDCWPNGTGVCAGAHFAKVTGYLYFVKNVCDKIDARHHQILVAGADYRLIWKCIVFFFNRENEMCPMNHFLVLLWFFPGQKTRKYFYLAPYFPNFLEHSEVLSGRISEIFSGWILFFSGRNSAILCTFLGKILHFFLGHNFVIFSREHFFLLGQFSIFFLSCGFKTSPAENLNFS